MPSSTISTLSLLLLSLAASVYAHGFVQSIVINGAEYQGYNVFQAPYQPNPPTVIGWSNTATDSGFVSPAQYNTPDIICHLNAKNARGHAKVKAGETVWMQWNDWPESHHGPVLDYLAACGDKGCESVAKTDLRFFKISEGGLVDGSAAPGFYAADELLKNGKGWLIRIPESIKPGFYVLRHEIIALHSSHEKNGAQNYPQCVNLEITGSGTEEPEGVPGMELYKPDDAGIFLNIYRSMQSYKIPGPAVIKGAGQVKQVKPAVTGKASATTGNNLSPAPTDAPAGGASSAAPEAPKTTSAPAAGNGSGNGNGNGNVSGLPSQSGPTKTVSITPGQTNVAGKPQDPVKQQPKPPANLPICKKKGGKKSKRPKHTKKAKRATRGAVPRV